MTAAGLWRRRFTLTGTTGVKDLRGHQFARNLLVLVQGELPLRAPAAFTWALEQW